MPRVLNAQNQGGNFLYFTKTSLSWDTAHRASAFACIYSACQWPPLSHPPPWWKSSPLLHGPGSVASTDTRLTSSAKRICAGRRLSRQQQNRTLHNSTYRSASPGPSSVLWLSWAIATSHRSRSPCPAQPC